MKKYTEYKTVNLSPSAYDKLQELTEVISKQSYGKVKYTNLIETLINKELAALTK